MRKFIIVLSVLLLGACKTQEAAVVNIALTEPEFEIVSIIIIQADLINTQFETVLKINNPNNKDIQLSSIQYRLYGNGMFWAEGSAEDLVTVPAESSVQTKFRFSMNFINMNRRLLDDVITMRQVRYIFKGEAKIKIDIPRSPVYNVEFDISGLSDVKPKAD